METQYSIFAMDWDYESPNSIREINERQRKGIYCPCADTEILEYCGTLPGFTKAQAIAMAKKLKKKYPFVQWSVCMGLTLGELQPIETF